MNTHTPGPWKIESHIDVDNNATICNEYGDTTICRAPLNEAHLIAAAPAMYEAGCLSLDIMERVEAALKRMGNEGLRSIVRSAIIEQKAALAIAEGRTPSPRRPGQRKAAITQAKVK